MRAVQVPVGIGRTDQPVPAPRDDEQHRLLGPQDQPGIAGDRAARDQQVDSLAGAYAQARAAAEHLGNVIAPDPGGGHHGPGLDVELLVALHVPYPHAHHLAGAAQHVDDPSAGDDRGAEGRGRTSDRHGVPGVVDLAVEIADRADQRVVAQAREQPASAGFAVVLVDRQPAGGAEDAAEEVVEQHTGADIAALPHVVLQRDQERHRSYEVRRELGQQQTALLERLPDQREVELFEVAQAAVNQLAGPAGRAGGEVARLHQGDRQTTGGGVQRHSRAGHPAADDDHVEGFRPHPLDRAFALLGAEVAGGEPGTLRCLEARRSHVSLPFGYVPPSPLRSWPRSIEMTSTGRRVPVHGGE